MESVLGNMNPVLQMLTVMSLFSLLPFVFCCMTSFLRFTIVFSLLKTAMGVQVPPAIVTIGLCMILTFYTMDGVFEKMYERGSIPYQKNQNLILAVEEGSKPLKEFMLKQTRESDLAFFIELKRKTPPNSKTIGRLEIIGKESCFKHLEIVNNFPGGSDSKASA